jgi:hypothetical protein
VVKPRAKSARRAIKPWTKEDVRMLKAHSKCRTPVIKVSKVMKRVRKARSAAAPASSVSVSVTAGSLPACGVSYPNPSAR